MTATRTRANRPRLGLAAVIALAMAGADGPGAAVPSDPRFTALRTDGTTLSGRLRRLDDAGGVALAVDGGAGLVAVPDGALVKLTREAESRSTADGETILFPDGDRLARCVIGPAGETALEVQSFAIGTLAVPLDAVLGLVLAPPIEADAAFVLESRVRDEPRATEVLWLANGDRLAGGLLGIDDKTIRFRPAAGEVAIDRAGVIALGFDPKLVAYPKPAGPYLDLTLVDGSRLGVTGARVDGGHVLATTRYGQPIKLPVGELARVHAMNGSVAYLSDREPAGSKYVGYLGPPRAVRRDRAVDGQPLRLGGTTYGRGLGAQSRSYVVYRLEPGVKRFQALVGLDDRAGPLGSVAFRVVVDKQERFSTPPMSSSDAPRPLDLDVAGAKTLVLITDFGERGEVRDHADWVEARLVR